eukprot:COSAG05_NODE_28_length_29121_cov_56.951933_22_plen_313_part_00
MPHALNVSQQRRLSSAIDTSAALGTSPLVQDAVRELLVNPVAVWYMNQLIGAGYRLDTAPELLLEVSEPVLLSHGALPRLPKDAFYYSRLGKRQCNSVRMVIALDSVSQGDGGISLVPCSHTVNIEAPGAVLHKYDALRHLGEGIWQQPPMQAGDMLVIAGACIQALQPWHGTNPQRLLSLRFVGRSIVSNNGPRTFQNPNSGEPWWESLSDAQRASLGQPTLPAPTILSDGVRTSLDWSGNVAHPSIYKRDPDSGIDELEVFHWELCGYLVLRAYDSDQHIVCSPSLRCVWAVTILDVHGAIHRRNYLQAT